MSKVVAIIQARMRSTRLPGKVMADIAGKPAIDYTLARVNRASSLKEMWLACSDQSEDDPLAAYARGMGLSVFRGDEKDVMSRFAHIARETGADVIARITGDCPFADPEVIDAVVGRFLEGGVDFVSNTLQRSFPDGLDVEVFSREALERADKEATDPFLRGHVTPYIHGRLRDRLPWGGFTNAQVVYGHDFSHLRWTLDEPDDLEFFRAVVPELPEVFGWLDVVSLLTRKPKLTRINHRHKVYEGTLRDLAAASDEQASDGLNKVSNRYAASNRYFQNAIKTIPLASQTFSKSYQQWVAGAAPLFLQSGRGCHVRDIDGNDYIDYLLGLLPIILGYCDRDVDEAIRVQLDEGIVFSLPHPGETVLAEKLVELIPCAEMVRFGKNGSDATSGAVRLARAHTGRDKVAICGYHGWHDWYIGTTTRNLGVPEQVRALSGTFAFNDAEQLADMLACEPDAYAAIILEPCGSAAPEPGFLERIREVTENTGTVLIFDEIVAGFRIHLGGAQAYYGVTPDLACFGKAMANGMPISALVGRADIMKRMDDIFFSATFGGEMLSVAAALATIAKLESENVVDRLWSLGDKLRDGANEAFQRNGLGDFLGYAGQGWWPRISIKEPPVDANLLTSLLRQEFNVNGLILAASFNLCLAHDDESVIAQTMEAIDASAALVRDALDSPDPASRLRGDAVRPTFSVR